MTGLPASRVQRRRRDDDRDPGQSCGISSRRRVSGLATLEEGAGEVAMMNASNVFVYQVTTKPNLALRASVESVVLAILDSRPDATHQVWTVAVTMEQATTFRGL